MSDFMWYDEVNPVEKAQKTAKAVEAVRNELTERGIIAYVMNADSLPEAEQRLAMREVNAAIDEIVERHMPEDEGAKARLVSSIFKQFEAAERHEDCGVCGGRGKLPGLSTPCGYCGGTGRPRPAADVKKENHLPALHGAKDEDDEDDDRPDFLKDEGSDSDDDDDDDDDDDKKKKRKSDDDDDDDDDDDNKKRKNDEDDDDDDDKDSEDNDEDEEISKTKTVDAGIHLSEGTMDPRLPHAALPKDEDEDDDDEKSPSDYDVMMDQIRMLQESGDNSAWERIVDPEGYYGEGF